MAVYYLNGTGIDSVKSTSGSLLAQAYDIDGAALLRNPLNTSLWLINQTGYDAGSSKRATYTGEETTFTLNDNETDVVVFSGIIENNIADFSSVSASGSYYLQTSAGSSYSFDIAPGRAWDVMAKPALDFMAQARQDAFDTGGNTGYAWRDSHQFGFELNGLVMEYMADPSYFNALPYGIYRVSDCEYEELRVQDCPDIIWLMKFAVTRYHDWNVNESIDLHALIKAQVAYFLYIYPQISQYVDASWYQAIRDWIITQWSVSTCNKSWYEVSGGIDHNLFTTQAKIGTVKGMLPPGYAVVPNFLMYEVCGRDGLTTEAAQFLTAAQNNIAWLVNQVDLTDPANTKGQRMSEGIVFHALTYAYEMFPDKCPSGTLAKIEAAADALIALSDNMWDYTKYSSTRWVNLEASGGLCNNPGYIGMVGTYYALARVCTGEARKNRLKELATAHLDHGFGRNPLGRCYDFKATDDFEDAKLGWVSRYIGGLGHLDDVTAVLDGSPKEENFPNYPNASTGYSEGWVAFNSAWNLGLAYYRAESANGIGIFAREE